jgi:hypothetical protein
MGLLNLNSRDVSIVAVLSAMLAVIEATIFSYAYPALPPIVVIPFVSCFYFGVSLAFSKRQALIGVLGFLLSTLLRGSFLPGQLMIPIYGLLFQISRKDSRNLTILMGFLAVLLHVLYGVLLAPLIFRVAPAQTVLLWLIDVLEEKTLALFTMIIAFCALGMFFAETGRRLGLALHKNVNGGEMQG